ncbi:protein CHUP1, chloroplastic-like [Cornus florida]|uniref:protein CHUP1, chloroplastic-like n=1 Tax=Cornus florida TaxID=4283 RepID=UPI00289AB103|nr:protein CHUP1, chloroplastic-like [Cornus florida]
MICLSPFSHYFVHIPALCIFMYRFMSRTTVIGFFTMCVRLKRGVRPLVLKFGVALALSLGGVLYTVLRSKRIEPGEPPGSPHPMDCDNQDDKGEEKAGLGNDHHASKTTFCSCNPDSIAPEKWEESCVQMVTIDNTTSCLSPSSRYDGEKDGFLLTKFNGLVKELDLAATKADISPVKGVEAFKSDLETTTAFRIVESVDHEQEINNLRNMVRFLRERERALEIQLLDYYGLKEQETAVMELQNRLKINHIEAKLFTLKLESLQADNERLEARVDDYVEVVAELEAARAKIKLLKKKLRSEAEQNKEQILALQDKVTELQDREHKAVANDPDIQLKLQRLKDVEEEAEELRKSNRSLWLENSDLAQRLESTQILAISVLEDHEAEPLTEENNRLRQENEGLVKEIEGLQADRCADAEEVVYLRWINACLRYELRNYQPGTGKTIARDLSKTLSPDSENKAKQLILEYANRECLEERGINNVEFDSDRCSSSQSSFLTDSGEFDDSSGDNSSANRSSNSSKTKLFTKLRRLLRGHESHPHSQSSSLDRNSPVGDVVGAYCNFPRCNSSVSVGMDARMDGNDNRLRTTSHVLSRHSSYLHRYRNAKVEHTKDLESFRKSSDMGSSGVYKRFASAKEAATGSRRVNQLHQESESIQRAELLKYAEALKASHSSRFHGGSASFGSF